MVSKMESTKKKASVKKNAKKNLISASTKRKLLIAGIIAFVVLVCGGYLFHQTGVPARVLTGAAVAGESVKVNEINYHFYESYNMYYQYGILTSKDDLDKVFDEATGQTYRDYLYNVAAQSQQNIVLLNQEAKAAGFKAEYASRQVDAYIESLRDYASTNNTTADRILKSQYGVGITVRDVENFMTRELTAQEYSEYLKQTKYTLTEAQMQELYAAAPADYDKVTFNAYLVAADISATATDDEKAAALTAAKEKAQGILDAATDAQTFRDASETAAGPDGASAFVDSTDPTLPADPTINENYSKSDISSYMNSDLADYLFDAARKAGDMTVIETDTGAYAVYFQSRQLDTDASVSYRMLFMSGTDIAATKAKVEELKAAVTDEASFISLVKKNSDDTNTALAGGLTSNKTAAAMVTDAATDSEKALTDWLFSADRKAGDMTIIDGVDGVTLYYFQQSLPAWEATLAVNNASTEYQSWYTALAAEEGNGYTVNYSNLKFATY